MTTNLERWHYYMKDKVAPVSFIDMGFYAMIAAALQRRVWTGSYDMPLFPNMYIVLVAGPGIGKGIIIKPVKELVSSIIVKTPLKMLSDIKTSVETLQEQTAINEQEDTFDPGSPAIESQSKIRDLNNYLAEDKKTTPMLAIPHAADCTTFEAIVRDQAKSIRSIITGKRDKFCPRGRYTSNPMSIFAEEMGTLFRKRHEDLIRYFLAAFDCGDFEYKTKNQGEDIIKFLCLNILAGTNPGFMRESISARVIEEGFSARTIFVYENAKRFERFDQATIDESQRAALLEVRSHVEKLTRIYGQVEFTPEAYAFLKHYVEEVLPVERNNIDSNLVHYYARKNIHVCKMAMAVHFADNLDLTITKQECEKALAILDSLETKMHYALSVGTSSTLAKQAKNITNFLKKYGRACPYKLIYYSMVTEKEMDRHAIEECIHFLTTIGQITKDTHGNYVLIKEKV